MLVKEKVKDNYLITVTSPSALELKVKNINFLFPIKDLSIGFPLVFSINEINCQNAYILINRILDKQAIDILEKLLKEELNNIKGICFTDLGVINLVKNYQPQLELIYFQTHNTTNYASINYYLEDVDSILISTDITKEEILSILDKTTKPLVLPYFILADVMYSRRTLLSNYKEVLNLPKKISEILVEPISKETFIAFENEYGTMFYNNKYLDYRTLNHSNILYKYINPLNLTDEQILKVINGDDLSDIADTGFLNIATYYKLKEEEQ